MSCNFFKFFFATRPKRGKQIPLVKTTTVLPPSVQQSPFSTEQPRPSAEQPPSSAQQSPPTSALPILGFPVPPPTAALLSPAVPDRRPASPLPAVHVPEVPPNPAPKSGKPVPQRYFHSQISIHLHRQLTKLVGVVMPRLSGSKLSVSLTLRTEKASISSVKPSWIYCTN